MSRNHPDRTDDPLLESARRILTHEQNTHFTVRPWREIMAATKEQAAASKAAAAKITAKGITPFKHVPGAGIVPDATLAAGMQDAPEAGVDNPTTGVVQSGFSIFNPPAQGTIMTEATKPAAQADREQAAKDKIAAKQAKLDAAAAKKAQAEADKAEAQRVKAEKKAAADKERADKAEAARKERAEATEKAAAEGKTVRERTYEGSMLALADRTKSGVYVKGANGQMRSGDPIALALETVPAPKVVGLLLEVLGVHNTYAALNYGQQSMNLRNRLRGAIRRGAKVGDTDEVVTLDRLIAVRDAGDYKIAPPALKAEKAAETPAADPVAA
jgi:hypothetical protein